MNIYTVVILNTEAKPTDQGRTECLSFKSFDAAVEYLLDFLVDEGIIETSGVPDAEKFLRDNHALHAYEVNLELHIDENKLCGW